MQLTLTLLKCKLHRACVTHADLEYEGSCAIDSELMAMAEIVQHEQIHIYNVSNGERFVTYAIAATPGSRTISINGAAAHKAKPRDRIIICAYTQIPEVDAHDYQPVMVYLDAENSVIRVSKRIPYVVKSAQS